VKKYLGLIALGLFVVAVVVAPSHASGKWMLKGKAVTTDNCAVGCPCLLGEPPTHETCRFVAIMDVEKGNMGDVSLDGVLIGVAGEFAREHHHAEPGFMYVAYYIDSGASKEQRDALRAILTGPMFAAMGKPAEIKEVPITLNGIENFGKVNASYGGMIGDIAKIDISPIAGFAADKPMVIDNSAEPLFHWTALGKSKACWYKGGGQDFKFDGTSGESHKFDLAGGE